MLMQILRARFWPCSGGVHSAGSDPGAVGTEDSLIHSAGHHSAPRSNDRCQVDDLEVLARSVDTVSAR